MLWVELELGGCHVPHCSARNSTTGSDHALNAGWQQAPTLLDGQLCFSPTAAVLHCRCRGCMAPSVQLCDSVAHMYALLKILQPCAAWQQSTTHRQGTGPGRHARLLKQRINSPTMPISPAMNCISPCILSSGWWLFLNDDPCSEGCRQAATNQDPSTAVTASSAWVSATGPLRRQFHLQSNVEREMNPYAFAR